MPINSRRKIGSFSHILAIIVIQNVLVLKQIMDMEIGATDAPRLKRKKLICPKKIRQKSDHFFSHGNIFNGLKPTIRHQTIEKGSSARQSNKTNSVGFKPLSFTSLKAAINVTIQIIARLIAIIATHLLSFGSSDTFLSSF